MKRIFIIISMLLLQQLIAVAQQWTVKTPMPSARLSPAIAVYNNKIYIFGGADSVGAGRNTTQIYDVTSNSWSFGAPMTVSRDDVPAATVNGKIYVIGGYTNSGQTSAVEEYNPATNTWATKTSMPTARSQCAIGVLNNKIYVAGGWPGQFNTLEVYDPATDTWATKNTLPLGIISMNSSVVFGNNEMYLIGGRDYSGNNFDSVYRYNANTDSWTNINHNLPVPTFAGAGSVINNKIHFFAGKTANCQTCLSPNVASHYIFDTLTNSWTSGLIMLQKRSYHVCATVNGNAYVIGGADSNGIVTNANEEYSEPGPNEIIVPKQFIAHIYPNPLHDRFEIDIESAMLKDAQLRICNMSGQVVLSSAVSETHTLINTTLLAAGVYNCNISSGGQTLYEQKLIIEK